MKITIDGIEYEGDEVRVEIEKELSSLVYEFGEHKVEVYAEEDGIQGGTVIVQDHARMLVRLDGDGF